MDTLTGALWGVVASIGASALVFFGANRLFDLAVDHWRLFVASVGALGGAVFFWVLVGNRLVNGPGVLWVAAGTALGAALALVPTLATDRRLRLALGTISGVLVGLVIMVAVDEAVRPTIRVDGLLILVGIIGGLYLIPTVVVGKARPGGVLATTALGWVIGCWLFGDPGEGSATTMAVAVVARSGKTVLRPSQVVRTQNLSSECWASW